MSKADFTNHPYSSIKAIIIPTIQTLHGAKQSIEYSYNHEFSDTETLEEGLDKALKGAREMMMEVVTND